MTSIARPYSELPRDELHRVEFSVSAGAMTRVHRLLEKYRHQLEGGRNQLLEELLEGFLGAYEREVLAPRRGNGG